MQDCYKIIEKPNNVSWEELAKLQQRAHQENNAKGIKMQCANYTGEQLKASVDGGNTFVALNSSGEVKAMLSVVPKKVNRWWHRGIAGYICYIAVAIECQGKGIYKQLSKVAYDEASKKGINVVYLNTHIDNVAAQKAYLKDGYKLVRFSPGSGTDYYSVEMAKWLDGKGINEWVCKMMFLLSKLFVKVVFKPGKIRRF